MASIMWDDSLPMNILHANDRVRIYGVVMYIPENRVMYNRLVGGHTSQMYINDPAFNLEQIC